MRKPNLWNTWQHLKKQAKSGHIADIWALNLLRAMMSSDRLETYEKR